MIVAGSYLVVDEHPNRMAMLFVCELYIYIYLGKFDHDLTVLPNPGIMVNEGNHPLLWPPDSCGDFFGNLPNISYHLKMVY